MIQPSLFSRTAPAAPKGLPKNCSLIYQPKGRAREYAALSCNVYSGCGHGCTYCYGASATRKPMEVFHRPGLRPNFLPRLRKEAAKYQAAGVKAQVLLCFTCDPYQPLDVEEQVTRETIKIIKEAGLNVCILTKGGSRALRDIDLLGEGDAFATTLTFLDDTRSLEWEPSAALPADRIATLRKFHEAGIDTWVSLEPVIDPAEALKIIHQTHEFVDLYKVGTWNYDPRAQAIDWHQFVHEAIALLESLGKEYYIKADLRKYL